CRLRRALPPYPRPRAGRLVGMRASTRRCPHHRHSLRPGWTCRVLLLRRLWQVGDGLASGLARSAAVRRREPRSAPIPPRQRDQRGGDGELQDGPAELRITVMVWTAL